MRNYPAPLPTTQSIIKIENCLQFGAYQEGACESMAEDCADAQEAHNCMLKKKEIGTTLVCIALLPTPCLLCIHLGLSDIFFCAQCAVFPLS